MVEATLRAFKFFKRLLKLFLPWKISQTHLSILTVSYSPTSTDGIAHFAWGQPLYSLQHFVSAFSYTSSPKESFDLWNRNITKHETLTCRKLQPFKMVLPLAEFKLLLVTKYLILSSAFTWLAASRKPPGAARGARKIGFIETEGGWEGTWRLKHIHASGSPLQRKIL